MAGSEGADKLTRQPSDKDAPPKQAGEARLDAATDVATARAAAGEELGHTIVTGVKIVIDPKTGKLSLEGGPPDATAVQAANQAIGGSADAQIPEAKVVEPKIVEEARAAAAAEGKPAPVATTSPNQQKTEPPPKEDPAGSGNRRLSAETLFAFALPEAVVNAADEALKVQTQNNIPAPTLKEKDYTTVKRTVVGRVAKGGAQTVLVLGGSALALLVALYLLFGGKGEEIVTTKEPLETDEGLQTNGPAQTTTVASAASAGAAATDPKPENNLTKDNGLTAASAAKTVAAGSRPGTPTAAVAETEQIADALKTFDTPDPKALADAIKEGIKLKNDKVVQRILAEAANPSLFVRVAVAKALFEQDAYSPGLRPQVASVLTQMLEDKDYLVRGYAARALGATRDKSVVPKLTARLNMETEEVVKKLLRSALDQLQK